MTFITCSARAVFMNFRSKVSEVALMSTDSPYAKLRITN